MKEMRFRIVKILLAIFLLLLSSPVYSQTSIFTSQIPTSSGNDGDYELGLKFSSTEFAQISAIRFYKIAGEINSHTATLWSNTGSVIATASFSGETGSGWQSALFSSPVIISPNIIYVASVNANSMYAIAQHQLDNPITNGFLTAEASGGVFNETPGNFPTQTYQNSNYFVDVVADPINRIFTSQTPAGEFNDGPYEMGVKFTTSQAAKVKMFSYYKVGGESGTHIGRLWSNAGTLLASATFTNESASGWQYASLASNVYIQPGNTYVVSVNSNTAYGAGASQSLASSITNGILSTVADGNNGVFSGTPNTQGQFPTSSFNNNNYFRDILVEPISAPTVPTLISPANLATGVSIEPTISWSSIVGVTYTLQIATDVSFNNMIVNQSGLTGTTFNLSGLSNSMDYYWKVSAEKDFLTSGFSPINKFTTVTYTQVLLSWPINGISLYSSPVSLTWYIPAGGSGWKYDLLYSTDINMTSPVVITNITVNQYSLGGLLSGTKYYWKIRLKTASGVIASYSNTESFVTFGKAIVPVPSTPINDAIVYILSPTLYWYLNEASTNLTYDVEVREGSTSALTGTPTSNNLSSQSLALSGLEPGKKYSWQVRSKSGIQYSGWSIAESFNTVATLGPVIPIPSWPVGGATVYTTTLTLNWYIGSSSAGLTFEVEYVEGLATSFSGTPNILNINSLSTTLTNLIPGKDYKWHIRSTDGTSTSAWSTTESFSIISSVSNSPVVPIPSWPVNSAIVYSNSVQLNWYLGTYSTGLTYEVELRTGSLNGTPTVIGLSNQYTIVNNLLPATTYSWRVRSTNGTTTSGWSATASFVTINTAVTATTPILSWPIGGATVYTTSPTLTWFLNSSSVGITYELQYGTNGSMSGATTISGLTSAQYILSGLTNGSTYYWRVRSFDGTVYSSFSSIENFVTFAGSSALVTPIAASPSNGISIENSSALLSWFLPTQGKVGKYGLQYSKNADMQNATNLESNSNSQIVSGLESGKTYYWRVRSINSDGQTSAYSETEKFTPVPSSITGTANQKEIPTAFELKQNFPNPFNPTTVVEFIIPVQGFYSLEVYNILGQKVSSLLSSSLSPGNYKATFNGKDLTSGIYLYKLYGNNVNIIKKMLLIK